jgi:hypothetical protein
MQIRPKFEIGYIGSTTQEQLQLFEAKKIEFFL